MLLFDFIILEHNIDLFSKLNISLNFALELCYYFT